jgi:hypothetical protein
MEFHKSISRRLVDNMMASQSAFDAKVVTD